MSNTFWSSMSFQIWLDCHKFKNFPCLIMPMSTQCQKNEKKIQHHEKVMIFTTVLQWRIFDCVKE
jgi:hypothetical protein